MNGYGCTSIFSKTYKMHPEKKPPWKLPARPPRGSSGASCFHRSSPKAPSDATKKVGAWGALGARCRDLGYGGDLMGFIGTLMGFNGTL